MNANLQEGHTADEEAYNMVRASTKFQKMSQSIQLQTYKKYRSRLGALQHFPFGDFESLEQLDHSMVQSPKSFGIGGAGMQAHDGPPLSKHYKKFGPTIVQRVQPHRTMNLHGGTIVSTVRARRAAEYREYKRIER